METVKLAFLAVVLCAQACASRGSSAGEDHQLWSMENWQEEPQESGVAVRFADLMKRSKSQQFHGLMGRSSGVTQPVRLGRKRNKGEMFVGLMGRRSSSGEMQGEWNKHQPFY